MRYNCCVSSIIERFQVITRWLTGWVRAAVAKHKELATVIIRAVDASQSPSRICCPSRPNEERRLIVLRQSICFAGSSNFCSSGRLGVIDSTCSNENRTRITLSIVFDSLLPKALIRGYVPPQLSTVWFFRVEEVILFRRIVSDLNWQSVFQYGRT